LEYQSGSKIRPFGAHVNENQGRRPAEDQAQGQVPERLGFMPMLEAWAAGGELNEV
jgi:hypothetical protein